MKQMLFSFDIPHICHFFTQAKFLENKIYTEKRQFLPIFANFRQFLPIYTEICTEKHQFSPIFCVKSVKIYTGQIFFLHEYTRGPRDKYEVCFHTEAKPSLTCEVFARQN